MFTLTITGTAPLTAASIPEVVQLLTEQLHQRLPLTDTTVTFQITTPGQPAVPGGIHIPGTSGEPLSPDDEEFIASIVANIQESLTRAAASPDRAR